MSNSARNQLTPGDLPTLINHGLSALADTLQQDKHLTIANTALAIIGPADEAIEQVSTSGAARRGNFRVWENEDVDPILRAWRRSRGEPEDGPQDDAEEDGAAAEGGEAPAAAEGGASEQPAPAPDASGDVEMQ